MSVEKSVHAYELGAYVAELYDAQEAGTQDVSLLRQLLDRRGSMRILEPFFGTGRFVIPLSMDGHTVVGLDRAEAMLARASGKVSALAPSVRRWVTLRCCDVLADPWPTGFDLVVLGGNCLYE